MTWRLAITNLKDVKNGRYGGDYYLNTYTEIFFSLSDVWIYIGGRLKKGKNGYSGIKGDYGYTLTRI